MKSEIQRKTRKSRDELLAPPAEEHPYGSFSLSADGSAITCLLCGSTSRDARDVKEKYCPRCLVFHEDRTFVLRLTEGYQAAFHETGEARTWVRAA